MSGRVTYVGHATALIELAGVRVITDPLLRERFMHVPRHTEVPDPSIAADIDAVLISHLHADHLDPPSLRMIGRDVPLIVPKRGGPTLRRRGFGDVTELAPGASTTAGGVTVTATTAVHDARRYKLGRHVPALGYLLESPELRVYFAGDTDLFDEMDELAGIDVALLPIAGWGTRLGEGHLDPERAAEAAAIIRPRFVIPIHWGTFLSRKLVRKAPDALTAAPREFAHELEERAPGVELRVLDPGQSLEL